MGVTAWARFMAEVRNPDDIKQLLQTDAFGKMDRIVLGGGSNIIFSGDYDGLIIRNHILGIEILSETQTTVTVKINAGEVWDEVVQWAVSRNLGGIENLSLIPGFAGAAPIQNIGAYGVEICEVVSSVSAIHLASGENRIFSNAECGFGYRDSVFKGALKNQYIITDLTLNLSKNPKINTSYGAISEELEKEGITNPGIADVSRAVIRIRQSKLPDPKKIGNSGSFFKNTVIANDYFQELKSKFSSLPSYPSASGVKIPAGWLIEQAGLKGYRKGDAGIHKNQALVIVNYGNAEAAEIIELSNHVRDVVFRKFGILLEPEVNIV